MLLTRPSGNLFGLSQNAGMGWAPARLLDPEFLILSTHGGMRAQDGTPIALGFHTGHWEIGLLVAVAARELTKAPVVSHSAHRAAISPRHPALPDDTPLWAALIQASGGVWGGCVYHADAIIAQLAKSNAATETRSIP